MCIVTLSYNSSNALARRKLAELLSSGLFVQVDIPQVEQTTETEQKQETQAFLDGSRRAMSHVVARYL